MCEVGLEGSGEAQAGLRPEYEVGERDVWL